MTTFIRVFDVAVEEKASLLLHSVQAVASGRNASPNLFYVEPDSFAAVPTSPFSYWVSNGIRNIFQRMLRFEADDRAVRQGLATAEDFRFVRAVWEIEPTTKGSRWFGFAKGGAFSPFYADVFLCVNWKGSGTEIKNNLNAQGGIRSNVWMLRDTADKYFFRPGLTWPLRTQRGFGIRVMPSGCVFGHKGPAAFIEQNDSENLLALLAVATSSVFRKLVGLQMAFGSYEVGVIQRTPVPPLTPGNIQTLANLARRAWLLKRSLDTSNETSHAFLLPTTVNKGVREKVERELEIIQEKIDNEAFQLYGIETADRAAIESSAITLTNENDDTSDPDEPVDEAGEDETESGSDDRGLCNSWLVGVAFGRFDPRLATGERSLPSEPEPFDPLPSRSPGMYPEGEEPVDSPDILVDDEGHADDLATRVINNANRVKVDMPEGIRGWIAKEFFPLHIKMYSKSRRKAPIYWQLGTPSASYSVWLYIHAFSKDTLFRVQNDYVAPKLAHEQRRLESLTSELRDGASAGQRKQLATQAEFVEELSTFLDEVKRIAPLWKPNLDDGVIINFAPLWRLVPQNKSWQKELKSTWDALCDGKYDWAHLAMHLWPERVLPKCAKDRSLAIAHELEGVFWFKDSDGKYSQIKTPTKSIDQLIREKTSPAVKAALNSLLNAPAQGGAKKSTKRGKTNG
jgi:hypothetical protein